MGKLRIRMELLRIRMELLRIRMELRMKPWSQGSAE
jgi:hypothetical protein